MLKKIVAMILVIIIVIGANYIQNDFKDYDIASEEDKVDTINLKNNYQNQFEQIKIGDSSNDVIELVGSPTRVDVSEYDFNWYVYNRDLNNFFMIGIDKNKVVAMFSNSLESSELESINLSQNRNMLNQMYQPIEYKHKGNVKYMIESDEYDIFDLNGKYITVFYDIHNDYQVTSYQIIDKSQENTLKGIYGTESEELKKSYELEVIDLCNTARLKNDLDILEYDYLPHVSSEKHSEDMMRNNYFEHTNLEGESPFDRMKKENIKYTYAGENIAAGQTNAIYAHEAWMNSLGHRKNILGNYKYIGVGVSFGGHYKVYYTQNFYK